MNQSRPVWEYFAITATDDSKATCSVCNDVVPRGGSSKKGYTTSNLWHHLETNHPVEYRLVKDEQESGKNTAKRQLTMAESIEKTRPYEFDDSRSRRINKAERLFSSAADICTNTRNCLLPNKVEQLLF